MQTLIDNWGAIAAALLVVSEALSLIPAVKSNGVFQLIVDSIKKLAPKKP